MTDWTDALPVRQESPPALRVCDLDALTRQVGSGRTRAASCSTALRSSPVIPLRAREANEWFLLETTVRCDAEGHAHSCVVWSPARIEFDSAFNRALRMPPRLTRCFICAGPLSEEEVNDDHLPARQFFAKRARRSRNLQLLKLRAHSRCNSEVGVHEEYVATSLGWTAQGHEHGKLLLEDVVSALSKPEAHGLVHRIAREIKRDYRGIALPGMSYKTFSKGRVFRVFWKLLCGLYAVETGCVLPESAWVTGDFRHESDGPNEVFEEHLRPRLPRWPQTPFPDVLDYGFVAGNDDEDVVCCWLSLWETFTAWMFFDAAQGIAALESSQEEGAA